MLLNLVLNSAVSFCIELAQGRQHVRCIARLELVFDIKLAESKGCLGLLAEQGQCIGMHFF